jgi:hypothetical protein
MFSSMPASLRNCPHHVDQRSRIKPQRLFGSGFLGECSSGTSGHSATVKNQTSTPAVRRRPDGECTRSAIGILTFIKNQTSTPAIISVRQLGGCSRPANGFGILTTLTLIKNERCYSTNAVNEPTNRANRTLANRRTSLDNP